MKFSSMSESRPDYHPKSSPGKATCQYQYNCHSLSTITQIKPCPLFSAIKRYQFKQSESLLVVTYSFLMWRAARISIGIKTLRFLPVICRGSWSRTIRWRLIRMGLIGGWVRHRPLVIRSLGTRGISLRFQTRIMNLTMEFHRSSY